MICEETGMISEKVRKACKEVAKNDLDRVVRRGAPQATAFGYERSYSKEQRVILDQSQRDLDLLHEANVAACQGRVAYYKGLKGKTS